MYLLDTNIFLEVLLGQTHAAACEEFISLLSERKRGWVTGFSLHAIEAILGDSRKFDVLSRFLVFIETHPYINIYFTTIPEERSIAESARQWGLDFDDGLQYFITKQKNLILVTLDRDFSKMKGLKVIRP